MKVFILLGEIIALESTQLDFRNRLYTRYSYYYECWFDLYVVLIEFCIEL